MARYDIDRHDIDRHDIDRYDIDRDRARAYTVLAGQNPGRT